MTDTGTRWSEPERRLVAALHRAVDDAEPSVPAPTAPRPVAPPVDLGRRRRRWVAVAVPLVAACLVAAVVVGIGAATRDTPDPAATSPTSPPPVQPASVLRGKWAVQLPADVAPTMASVSADRLSVHVGECADTYSFSTHSDGLISIAGLPQTACSLGDLRVGLSRATRFEVVSTNEFLLRTERGDLIATFQRAGVLGDGEPVKDAVGVAALPVGLRAPSVPDLQGTWRLEGEKEGTYWVRFESLTWTWKSDCDVHSSGFLLSAWGGLLGAGHQGQADQSCDTEGAWTVNRTARLGLDGAELVMLAANGSQLARLVRVDESSETLLDQVQGDWEPIGMTPSAPGDLWLRIDGEWLRHAFNAVCNTADDELRLSGDGWVVGSRRAQAGGCEPGGEELLPGIVERVELDGDQLVVIGIGGDELRRFERAGTDTVLERAQGRWDLVSAWPGDRPMWLEVDGVNLTHAGNAGCNTDETGYRLASDGSVDETVDAYELLPEGTVSCQPGGPQLVQGRVGRIRLDGDQLVLIARTGSEIARFERADP